MTNLGWGAPVDHVDAATAQRGIMSQHADIRVFLSRTRAIAEAALDGDILAPGAVANAVGNLRTIVEGHLDFEERVWLPVLHLDDLMLGPGARADRMLADHRSQRSMLAALHKEASRFPELPMLAAKLAFLASWLEQDMEEEERALLP